MFTTAQPNPELPFLDFFTLRVVSGLQDIQVYILTTTCFRVFLGCFTRVSPCCGDIHQKVSLAGRRFRRWATLADVVRVNLPKGIRRAAVNLNGVTHLFEMHEGVGGGELSCPFMASNNNIEASENFVWRHKRSVN